MDERKRTIGELELKKKESLRSLGAAYEGFGETLFGRAGGEEGLPGADSGEYLRLRKEIADSEDLIKLTEADIRRLKELEGEILAKEREHGALASGIQRACADLGRDAVEEEAFSSVLGPYLQQIGQILPKLQDARARQNELEDRAGAGFFGWIGKHTRQAVYKTLAVKHEGALRKIYAAAGDRLSALDNEILIIGHSLEDAVRSVRDMKEQAAAQVRELDKLREERRRLGSAFSAEGGPVRRIQNLEKHIAQIQAELKLVYRRVGELAAAECRAEGLVLSPDGGGGERFRGVLRPEDNQVLEMVERGKEQAAEYSREIEKLKTAIAIDDEKAEIEKMERAIVEQRQRIAAAEGRIGELNRQIDEAGAHIEELSALL
jgi:predicted RNase H-like nuclease (RuvC/YqgF family)